MKEASRRAACRGRVLGCTDACCCLEARGRAGAVQSSSSSDVGAASALHGFDQLWCSLDQHLSDIDQAIAIFDQSLVGFGLPSVGVCWSWVAFATERGKGRFAHRARSTFHKDLFLAGDAWSTQTFTKGNARDVGGRKYMQLLRSGPREVLHWDPSDPNMAAAIVTCGGICPGLNSVIRELVW